MSSDPTRKPFDVLIFSRTTGHYRHDSIPAGIAMIEQLGETSGFGVTATEDAGRFTVSELRRYAAVVWLNTGGDVLDDEGRPAFESYIAHGGGYVGIHAAAATEYG
jgi:cytochrome c